MIDLELIAQNIKKAEKLRQTLENNKAPLSTLRYYDGVIDAYKEVIQIYTKEK